MFIIQTHFSGSMSTHCQTPTQAATPARRGHYYGSDYSDDFIHSGYQFHVFQHHAGTHVRKYSRPSYCIPGGRSRTTRS